MEHNFEIHFLTAYYPLGANTNLLPEYIGLYIVDKSYRDLNGEFVLPINRLTAKEIRAKCPLLDFGMSDRKVNQLLKRQLAEELDAGRIPRGYCFHKLGAQLFPDGALRFLRGDKLYPENCPSPYMLTSEIADVQLVGDGNTHPSTIRALLLTVPLEALLSIAYTMLTSVRSFVLDSGVDLQAVLYIEGAAAWARPLSLRGPPESTEIARRVSLLASCKPEARFPQPSPSWYPYATSL